MILRDNRFYELTLTILKRKTPIQWRSGDECWLGTHSLGSLLFLFHTVIPLLEKTQSWTKNVGSSSSPRFQRINLIIQKTSSFLGRSSPKQLYRIKDRSNWQDASQYPSDEKEDRPTVSVSHSTVIWFWHPIRQENLEMMLPEQYLMDSIQTKAHILELVLYGVRIKLTSCRLLFASN